MRDKTRMVTLSRLLKRNVFNSSNGEFAHPMQIIIHDIPNQLSVTRKERTQSALAEAYAVQRERGTQSQFKIFDFKIKIFVRTYFGETPLHNRLSDTTCASDPITNRVCEIEINYFDGVSSGRRRNSSLFSIECSASPTRYVVASRACP
jgi:hypothetical protein